MNKKYYQHSIWGENNKEWIESDSQTFNDEVVNYRNLYNLRYDFKENKTIYYFDNKDNPAYDWKVVLEA